VILVVDSQKIVLNLEMALRRIHLAPKQRYYLPGSYVLISAKSELKHGSYLVIESLWSFLEG
jgi:hypothetical protein